MKKKNLFLWLALLLIVLALTGRALAQTSANFNLDWHVFTGGGGTRSSAAYTVQDSFGQFAAGASNSASMQIQAGFWNGNNAYLVVYLPLVVK
jgi:hypothetical protein